MWASLGEVAISEQWQSFPQSIVNSPVIRLSHNTTFDLFNSCWIAQYFPAPAPGGRFTPWRRIHADADPQILILPYPESFEAAGSVVFDLQVRWKIPYAPTQWVIHAEVWLG